MKTLLLDAQGLIQPPPSFGWAYYVRTSQIVTDHQGDLVQVCIVERMDSPVPPQITSALGTAR